jgi:hypothetical protein
MLIWLKVVLIIYLTKLLRLKRQKKMTNNELEALKKWATEDSDDTNEYCERLLLIEALRQLENDPPNVKLAILRLREVLPVDNKSRLVRKPDFVEE